MKIKCRVYLTHCLNSNVFPRLEMFTFAYYERHCRDTGMHLMTWMTKCSRPISADKSHGLTNSTLFDLQSELSGEIGRVGYTALRDSSRQTFGIVTKAEAGKSCRPNMRDDC